MTRRNNAAMKKPNYNIDYKKIVITWISFPDEVK